MRRILKESWDWANDILNDIDDITDNPHIHVVIQMLENHMNIEEIDVTKITMGGYNNMEKYEYDGWQFLVGDDDDLQTDLEEAVADDLDNNPIDDIVSNIEDYITYEPSGFFDRFVTSWVNDLDKTEVLENCDEYGIDVPEGWEEDDDNEDVPEGVIDDLTDAKHSEIEDGISGYDAASFCYDTFDEDIESLEGSGVEIDWHSLKSDLMDMAMDEPTHRLGGHNHEHIKSQTDGKWYHAIEVDW